MAGSPLAQTFMDLYNSNDPSYNSDSFDGKDTERDARDALNVTWPKFMFPLFKWFEKDTKIRRNILKIFNFIAMELKYNSNVCIYKLIHDTLTYIFYLIKMANK